MDLGRSRQEVLEFVTAAAGDPSTSTDLSLPASKDTVANEIVLTTVTAADETQSVMTTVEDAVSSAAAADTANRDGAETVDELTVPLASISASDSRESLTGLSQINATLQGLETLRLEMLSRLETTDGMNEDEHSTTAEEGVITRRLLESLECGIEEIQMMSAVGSYVHCIEAERLKQKAQIQRMSRENAWLRDELAVTNKRLQLSEQRCAALDEETSHLQFLSDLKTYQPDSAETEEVKTAPSLGSLDLGFPEDDEENQSDVMYPSQPSAFSQAAAGYEVPVRLRTLHNLVIQYASQGRYEVAVPLCKQAIEDLEKATGREHPDVATMLNILALVFRDQSKYKEAAGLLTEALAIRERTLGNEHPAVAATLNNLSVLLSKRGRYQEAEPLCKRALSIREKMLGKDHPDVAKQLNNLALICQNQARYEEVELYYQRALEIYTENFGLSDINVAKTKNNLAASYLKQGKYREAERLFMEVLNSAVENEQGNTEEEGKPLLTEPEVKDNRKDSLSTSRLDQHAAFYRSANVDSPTLTMTLKNLGALYKRQGKLEAATALENIASQKGPWQTSKAAEILGADYAAETSWRGRVVTGDQSSQRANRDTSAAEGGVHASNPHDDAKCSGSVAKLRASILRSGVKLANKMAGSKPEPTASES